MPSAAPTAAPLDWPRTPRAGLGRVDRLSALVYRGSLAVLALMIVTNAGAVIAANVGGVPATEAMVGLVGLQVLAHHARGVRDGVTDLTRLRAFVVVFGAYLATALASTLWAVDPDVALEGVVALATNMTIAGVLVLAIRDERDLWWILGGLLAGAGGIAAMVTLQTVTGAYEQDFFGFAGASVAHIAGETDDIRATGPYEDPNFFAQMMVAMVPLAAGLAMLRVDRRIRLLGAGLAGLMAVTVVLTFSRGALLALMAVGVALVYRHRRNRAVVRGAVVLGIVVLFALPGEYTARLTALGEVFDGGAASADDPSLQGRTSEMQAALQMFADRPAGGVGYANYPDLYLQYSPWIGLDPRREPREPHSLYLEIAAETGILGLGVFAIGLALARARIVRGRRHLVAVGSELNVAALDAIGLALIAYLMTAVFLHGAYPRVFWLLLGIALIAPWPILQPARMRSTGVA